MHFSKPNRPIKLMEICGTHTMSIARSGIKKLLPEDVKLISGPGCPVCVTPSSLIDLAYDLAQRPDILLCSYGDLFRIPGSKHPSLQGLPQVKICLSCMDALTLAQENPSKNVVFLGVGFETTAPGSAIAILEAQKQNIQNFFFLSLLKQTKPAICTLLEQENTQIDGFLCPGHVAAIIGEQGFTFLPNQYHRPGVISGFDPEDILYSIELLIQMLNQNKPAIQNTYERIVKPQGNQTAQAIIQKVFEPKDSLWRGLGNISKSGLQLKKEYETWDAWKRFNLPPLTNTDPKGCQCASILCGQKEPKQCPLFKTVCKPQTPIGPCMVSNEGACAASYLYESEDLL